MNPDQVSEMYNTGMSISAIGRAFCVSQPTVRTFMVAHGIKRRSHCDQSKLTNANNRGNRRVRLASAHDLLQDATWLHERWIGRRQSIQSIAREAKCSVTVVRDWLSAHGMPSTASRRRADYHAVIRAYAEGATLEQAALAAGISVATASRWTAGVVKRAPNSYDRPFTRISRGHQELIDFIQNDLSVGVQVNNRTVAGVELDVFVPSANLAIEFNGLFYHSEWGGGKDRNYHASKTKAAESVGINLLHIFEDDWATRSTIIKSMITHRLGKSSVRVGARRCNVVELSIDDRRDFFNLSHLQGDCSSTVAYGLIYEGQLVAAMSFRRPRFTRKWDWELIRYACRPGTSVVGGFSKLMSHFNALHAPKSIVSYSERSYSDGSVYSSNGFITDHTNDPSYHYLFKGKRYPRTTFTKDALLKKFGGDSSRAEAELARAAGLDRIWNCGTVCWVWTPS